MRPSGGLFKQAEAESRPATAVGIRHFHENSATKQQADNGLGGTKVPWTGWGHPCRSEEAACPFRILWLPRCGAVLQQRRERPEMIFSCDNWFGV